MPKVSVAVIEESSGPPAIGGAIRQRRQRRDMTLKDLSTKSGLSAPFLSQVERDQAMPSLVSLAQIAAALDVETSYFIGTPEPRQIVRRADTPEHLHVEPVQWIIFA